MNKKANGIVTRGVKGMVLAAALNAPLALAQGSLNVFNWSDYIDPSVITDFEAETGIKVTYDVFDTNEVLEARLLTGNSGYDIVVPGSYFLGRQIQAGIFTPLDREKLPNYKNLDPVLMQQLTAVDPENRYGIPYLWGTTGIGYNPEQVKKVLGEDAPINSWELMFNPENLEKLAQCGVSFLDTPSQTMPAALHYLGKDPNSTKVADYKNDVKQLLQAIRPYVRYFSSSQYMSDLANGDICVAFGYSGDVLQAAARAQEAGNGVKVEYVIPQEGAGMWFDMLAIPADSKNIDNAHQFLNYLMRPDVIARISNYVSYANPNQASTGLVNREMRDHPGVFPPQEIKSKLYTFKVLPPKITKIETRIWSEIKTNREVSSRD